VDSVMFSGPLGIMIRKLSQSKWRLKNKVFFHIVTSRINKKKSDL